MKRYLIRMVIIGVLLLPLWMFLCWVFTPKSEMVVAIVDKTVLTRQGQEHISLDWLLNYKKYIKPTGEFYRTDRDYFGFFPKENDSFDLKGLERFASERITALSHDADMLYITDTYGIYRNEWYRNRNETERSGIVYGGLQKNDLELLQLMKDQGKLVITEFNTFASPTSSKNRREFETMFGIHWSGWIGRYFDTLDTLTNKELPRWLIHNYKQQHNNRWPFKKSGIAFVDDNDTVVILEEGTHLKNSLPQLLSTTYGKDRFSLPNQLKYSFWFDIVEADTMRNTIAAHYKIDTNAKGKTELAKYGIPDFFPAVSLHQGNDYEFYYFSGDFCDNPIRKTTSYFKGIGAFKWLFYNKEDASERESFFWQFYRPMTQKILEDYHTKLKTGKARH